MTNLSEFYFLVKNGAELDLKNQGWSESYYTYDGQLIRGVYVFIMNGIEGDSSLDEMKRTKKTALIIISVIVGIILIGIFLLLLFTGNLLKGLCGATNC